MTEVISIADRLAAARAKLGAAAPTPPTPPTPPVAPSAPRVTFMSERTDNDELIDSVVERLDIVTAYNRYSRKGTVDPKGRTEGIKVRCPNPSHADDDPSAWINTEKDTWYCGKCEMGGDQLDIAAWYFDFPVPGYKDGKNFHDLRRRIAEDHGYVFQPTPAGVVVYKPDMGTPGPASSAPGLPSAPVAPALAEAGLDRSGDVGVDGDEPAGELDGGTVTALPVGELDDSLDIDAEIQLHWKPIVPPGTFLDVWMRQTCIDDVPEEYHFWNGIMAISLAIGKEACLYDFKPVYGNIFVCYLGKTGSGKTKGLGYLNQLLDAALPENESDPFSKGVRWVRSPASAEALIWRFQKVVDDPSAPKGAKPDLVPVKGLVDFNELSALVGRTQRAGNVMVPTLMQFYDMDPNIETVSRTHGIEKAVGAYASMVTTSQPRALRGLLSQGDAASGFLNRWLFCAAKPKPREAVGGARVDVLPAVKPLQDILGWAATAGMLNWSQEALDLFTEFFRTELEPLQKRDDTDLLNRLDLACKKLILLFTANMKHKEVQIEAVEQMMKVYPYLIECYGIPGATIGSSVQQEIRETVLRVAIEMIEKTGRGVSHRDIQQRIKHRKYPLDIYNRTIKYMMEIEELVIAPTPPGPGRPTTRYTVPDVATAKKFLERHVATPAKMVDSK